MNDFEERLKARTSKIRKKIQDALDDAKVLSKSTEALSKKFEQFAEEQQTEKAQKISEILGK